MKKQSRASSRIRPKKKLAAAIGLTVVAVLAASACGSSSKSSSSSTTTTPSSGGSTTIIKITPASFTADFSAMAQLKSLAAKGKGLIGVLLPDTTTSARYESFDRPYLTKAFKAAGLTDSEFKVDNAQGSATTMQTQAEADITNGASVLLDRRARLRQRCRDRGERRRPRASRSSTTTASPRAAPPAAYYVSFDNVKVGKLIGQGVVDCIAGVEGRQAEHPGDGRRPDRQQRHAVRRRATTACSSRSSTTGPT